MADEAVTGVVNPVVFFDLTLGGELLVFSVVGF